VPASNLQALVKNILDRYAA